MDLLTQLEHETDLPGVTQEQIDAARVEGARDMGRFSAPVWPTATIGDVNLAFGDPGYRDALCSLISREVTETEESSQAGLVIRFGLGEVIINP